MISTDIADRAGPSGVDPQPFDVCAELPTGTTVLEASAGTGKTYTIAALAARYVAEQGVPLGELMMVTFGRMATDELRERVRERLVATETQLVAVRAGRPPASDDRIARLLCTGDDAVLAERQARVVRALADFDAATIATTHEFCLQMLDGLGVLGDREPDAVFVEHLDELTAEVSRDVYLRRYAVTGDPPFPYDDGKGQGAAGLARTVVESAHAALVPTEDQAGSDDAAKRVAYAQQVRREVLQRKESARLFSYDDMLTRLQTSLAHPELGEQAATRLRSRYRVVLVDEFQDTDPVQWDILRRAFHGHTTLILIGDPKQAIYAFRGADVYSYLDAKGQADRLATLDTNWRSDAVLTEALDRLMGGAALGEDAIRVLPVNSHHRERRLLPPAAPSDLNRSAEEDEPFPLDPLRLRMVPPDPDPEQLASVKDLRPLVVQDLVADVTRLLAARPRLSVDGTTRPICPSDVAVLVRKNERGENIRDALVAAGVPAVMLGSASVFAAPVAQDWLTLLTALEQPRQASSRRAALTCFIGWTVADLAVADDEKLTQLSSRIRWWSRVLSGRGVAALMEVISAEARLTERLLAQESGERTLTDVRHIGQTLHASMISGRLGVAALVEWLVERMHDAARDGWGDGARRLETDAEAVQILTVHRSKGLQFPVVYLPEAWDQFVRGRDDGQLLRLHVDGRCVLDVGGPTGTGRAERLSRQLAEDAGEELRLLYVGLTRAQCQVVTWWAASHNTPASALQRFLFRAGRDGEPERSYPNPTDPLAVLASDPQLSVEAVARRDPVRVPVAAGSPGPLAVRRFTRELDLTWRRTSYSALTAAVYGLELAPAGVGSEPESSKEDDEPVQADSDDPALGPPLPSPGPAADPDCEGFSAPSPMRELPGGVEFGSVVHAVYEGVDPQAGDLAAALRESAARVLAHSPPLVLGTQVPLTADGLAAALLPSLLTPLGPLADDRTLSDFATADRLPELAFELPLAGGDHGTIDVRPTDVCPPDVCLPDVCLGDLAPLLARHLGPDDPLVDYPAQLAHPLLAEQPLRGYLTGSIDAVLRYRSGVDGSPRYLVLDYKTNWLGVAEGPVLTVGDYAPDRLPAAMMHAHYPLQALLYSVAVHRLLRWRQPSYDPDVHLGGVLYLFVRGMAGPDTPTVDGVPCGVFSWRPSGALVVELSDLLNGKSR